MFAARAAFMAGKALGNGSVYFDGTGDYLIAPSSAGQLGSGEWTIEAWVYPISRVNLFPCIFSNYSTYTVGGVALFAGHNSASSTKYNLSYNGSFPVLSSTSNITYNAWTHLALVRSGTTVYNSDVKLYVNGVVEATYSGGGVPTLNGAGTNGGSAWIGTTGDAIGSAEFNGYMSQYRVVVGTAVYTSTFTPPAVPLTAISGTRLLTCQSSTTVTDASTNNFTITKYGNAAASSVSPF